MECESMLFVNNHLPYLRDLSNSFSNSFIEFTALITLPWTPKICLECLLCCDQSTCEIFTPQKPQATNGFLAVMEQLLFLPICFTVCAIIAKNIGLSDFEINYKAHVQGETHATVQSYCITIEIGLWKTKRKRFQNFRQSCVLLTDRIEIHQSDSPIAWRREG